MYIYGKNMAFWASKVTQWVKILLAVQADVSSITRSGRSPGGGHSNPLQYSCLWIPMDRGAWRATLQRVTKSRTQLKRMSTQEHLDKNMSAH